MEMQKTNWIKTGAVAVVFTTIAAGSASAAVLRYQNFDLSSGDPTYWAFTEAGGNISGGASGANDAPGNSRGISGVSYRASNATGTLTFPSVSLVDYEDAQIRVPLAAVSKGANSGLDVGDTVLAYVALNGAAFSETPDLTIKGNDNSRWAFTATGVAQTIAGTAASFQAISSVASTPETRADGFATLLIDIPSSATSVAFKLVLANNDTDEVWAVDNIQLSATSIPEPATLGGLACAAVVLGRRRRHS